MYAVIFKATINQFDKDYMRIAARMRDLAKEKYGCIEFTSTTEGNEEIAISYWPGLKNIRDWKANPEHMKAQELGKQQYYKDYQVEVVEVLRRYANS